jgi:hypothetical protein
LMVPVSGIVSLKKRPSGRFFLFDKTRGSAHHGWA